jgi:DNA repair ATPase RecN
MNGDELASGPTAGTTGNERLAVANHVLETLAAIDDSSRETLESLKQECAREFEIAMSTCGKSAKELSARRNEIARSLQWQAKTKAAVAQIFPTTSD